MILSKEGYYSTGLYEPETQIVKSVELNSRIMDKYDSLEGRQDYTNL